MLIALYEKEVDFTLQLVDLQSDTGRNESRKIYPLGKVPLLVREDGWKIPECPSSLNTWTPISIPGHV